jgi:chaperonin cofactor prefoldin
VKVNEKKSLLIRNLKERIKSLEEDLDSHREQICDLTEERKRLRNTIKGIGGIAFGALP